MKPVAGMEVPYLPAPYEPHHIGAVQALARGDCPEHLQKEFLRWLIEDVCSTYDQSYRVDPYNTAFAEGKRFCGNQVIKMLHLDAVKVSKQTKARSENDG